MQKAHFIFTQHGNSLSVYVENLEQLTVEQIQQIEDFVQKRKGFFDFDTYTFVLQKRLEFHEFVSLVSHAGIPSECQEKVLLTQTHERIDFGKYKGLHYNQLSDAYLLWLKNNYTGKDRSIIELELRYRSL